MMRKGEVVLKVAKCVRQRGEAERRCTWRKIRIVSRRAASAVHIRVDRSTGGMEELPSLIRCANVLTSSIPIFRGFACGQKAFVVEGVRCTCLCYLVTGPIPYDSLKASNIQWQLRACHFSMYYSQYMKELAAPSRRGRSTESCQSKHPALRAVCIVGKTGVQKMRSMASGSGGNCGLTHLPPSQQLRTSALHLWEPQCGQVSSLQCSRAGCAKTGVPGRRVCKSPKLQDDA